eukprot:1277874-Pleurochrysis_carterae.AAC.1
MIGGRGQRAALCRVFEDEFSAGIVCCSQQAGSAAHYFVGLCELARVMCWHVGYTHHVVAIAHWRRSPVRGFFAREKPGHREG